MADTEKLYINIGPGDPWSDKFWESGEVITVENGGTLANSELSYKADSLIIKSGATITGTLTVAAEVTVESGAIMAGADVVWNISHRKKEEPLLWNDLGASDFNSLSITVSPNQNKGTYLLAGNAADFDGVITIQHPSGTVLGTVSLDEKNNVLDFDVTRYTLDLNKETGILTLTVSSNISDEAYYVFLYKNNQLVGHLNEGQAISVSSSGEYEHLVVIENGRTGDVKILSGGLVTVYSGAKAVGLEQSSAGKLRFDYTAGDTTVISGVNQYGTFLVEDDMLFNVNGENVSLSGALTVINYYSNGIFSAVDGVDISGVFSSGSSSTFKSGTVIHNATVSGNNLYFEGSVTVTDSNITSGSTRYFKDGTFSNLSIGGNYSYFYGGTFSNVTITCSSSDFYAGTYSDVVISGGTNRGSITLAGTLTVKGNIGGSGIINAAGNDIILDYTKRKDKDPNIIDGSKVSDVGVFYIDLLADQGTGTYNILGSEDNRSKYSFSIRVDGQIVGTLTENFTTFESGNYVYTMTSAKELTVDISERADATFNVLYWDSEGYMGHAADLFTVTTATGQLRNITVRRNGVVGDVTLDSGGLLEVNRNGSAVGITQKNNAALRFTYVQGDSTVISGINQYGTFFVEKDMLMNVIGEAVTLSGHISVIDYRATGKLTANNGVSFTGILDTGSSKAELDGVYISNATVTGSKVFNNVTVTNSNISGSTEFRSGSYSNVTVSGNAYYYGGTFSDAVWTSGTVAGLVELAGTLTIKGNISQWGSSNIKANYNVIVLDYTQRTVNSGALVAVNCISEDVIFHIALRDEQNVGTYTIASNAGTFIDTFCITIAGEIIGTLNNENRSFEYGNFVYTMGWDNQQNITLTIDVSENADERFNVLCYDSANALFYANEMTGLVIDGTNCAKVTVRTGGWLADAKLNNGIITVGKGANVYGIEQSASGKITFEYEAGDTTIISGVNQYGTFHVEDDHLINVAGENVEVTGDVLVENYHASGLFSGNGVTLKGTFYGSGTFENATIANVTVTGTATVKDSSTVTDSTFSNASFSGGVYSDVTVTGSASLSGGTYHDVTLANGGTISGRVLLNGDLNIGNNVTIQNYGAIDGSGYELNLDLTRRSPAPASGTMIDLSRVYNTELSLVVYANQTIGTYAIGSKAQDIGQGSPEGYWDIDTNTWLYKGVVSGDMDGVITIRSDAGITLANCTVNGNTEYFGRYNYRVYVDESNQLMLRIGWNNREDLTFAADQYDNDTLETATEIKGTGEITLTNLTIHSKTDRDWYKFTLERSGTASSAISINFKQWAGDLEINLYDAEGKLIDYAQSVTDNEELSLRGVAAGTYYVEVFGDSGNTNEYTLTANLPALPDFSDAYEKGNTADTPYYLSQVTSETSVKAAISEEGDADFYSFYLPRKGTAIDYVTLTFDQELGDLDLYLYDPEGKQILTKSISVNSSSEEISFKGLAMGQYLIKVVAKDGIAVADYNLNFTIRSRDVDPDHWEHGGNNSMGKAKNLHALNGADKKRELSIHSSEDEDYFKFKLNEDGSADDWISVEYEAVFGDIDIEILDSDGTVVRYSRSAENVDSVSLEGLEQGDYYIRVYGCNGTTNYYDLNWNVTNSGLIPSDDYEGSEPVFITQDQTISGLTIARPVEKDENRADTFAIQLEYDAWYSSKIILTGFRSDWEEGMKWQISSDPEGKNILASGIGSEISLANFKKGSYYLTVDAPVDNQYSEYSLIARDIPDNPDGPEQNAWSVFIYMAGDNNLEGAYLNELLWMQQAVLPAGVEVYVLMDRSGEYSVAERNWTDTRVGKIIHSPGGAVAVEWIYFEGEKSSTLVNTSNLEQRKEWDTGNVATLQAFLDWGMKNGKAQNYALIMKDHGSSLGYNSMDETSGSIMNITDIAELLSDPKYDDIKVVAFDQCLMGSDVVITTLEGNVDYIVASEAIGWTPNQLVMYKVLLNSFTADMTPQEMAQKIVKACNCSGRLDLTSASFHVTDGGLSDALNAFGVAAAKFTRADWVAICESFAQAYNYGDSVCAYSDLGFLLDAIRGTTETVSTNLLEAVDALYEVVINTIIDSTMITPSSYGTGFAVYNPVLSEDVTTFYTYGPGAEVDFYATEIGQNAWGRFLYYAGQLADGTVEFVEGGYVPPTFTDVSQGYVDEEVREITNLGAFFGDGTTYDGLSVTDSLYFTITLDNTGNPGDVIRVVTDNPDANITLTIIEQIETPDGIVYSDVRTSENGVLSVEEINPGNPDSQTEYFLRITSDQTATFDLLFEAEWSSGSDFFDYTASGNQLGAGGNDTIDKATVLQSGNYEGLMTESENPDYYFPSTVFANEVHVAVSGFGLEVYECDANGEQVDAADYIDNVYVITISKGNFLMIKSLFEEPTPYSMSITDVTYTFIGSEGSSSTLPVLTIIRDTEAWAQQVVFTATADEGLLTYVNTSGSVFGEWELFDTTFIATENGEYYFKAVDPVSGLESKCNNYFLVENIDNIAPDKPVVTADITGPTNGNVTLTAVYPEDAAAKEFSTDGGATWQSYEIPVVVETSGTILFRAVDHVGNVSEVTAFEVSNIDKVAPLQPEASADITYPVNGVVTVTAVFAEDSVLNEFSYDQSSWHEYTGPIEFSANGVVCFRSKDEAGNYSEVTVCQVNNIDTDAPEKPEASADITEWTNKTVTVSAVFDESSFTNEYSFNGVDWKVYTQGIEFTENGAVTFRSKDEAGNTSEVTVFYVTNIDKEAPKLTVSGNAEAWTAGDILLTAQAFDERGAAIYFKKEGDSEFAEYKETITVSENGIYIFYAEDSIGNRSEELVVSVDKIDKTAPILVITSDPAAWTNQDVLLSAAAEDDRGAVIYFKKEGDSDFTLYTEAFSVSENGTYIFYTEDSLGNRSEEKSFTVGNIDKVAPILEISGNALSWTNKDVILTAKANEEGCTIQYRIGEAEWQNYDEGVTVISNAQVAFKVTDKGGNEDIFTEKVTFIDKVAPDLEISSSNTAPTNKELTLSAAVSDGSVEYFDGENWISGSEMTVSDNGTYKFRVTDEAGNVTEKSFTVTNIDKVAPEAPSADADIKVITNKKVTVTARFSEDSLFGEYSFDGDTWQSYKAGVEFTENGKVYFRSQDEAGNFSEVISYEVSNIDTVAPDKPAAAADTKDPTNKKVTVTATFTEESVLNQYSLNERDWFEYTEGIEFESNGKVYFRSQDEAGNFSEVTVYHVTNIDKDAPSRPGAAPDVKEPTNGNVIVTATFDGTSFINEYTLDGGITWLTYNSGIEFTANGTVSFRSTDRAGNVSEITTVVVDNIDKTPPTLEIASSNTAPTNEALVLTATISDGKVEYWNGKKWVEGDSLTVTQNGTYKFRATDALGNRIEKSFEVTNIDRVAPKCPEAAADITVATNKNVTVTAVFSEDSVVKQYSLDNEIWHDYESAIVLSANGSVYFRGFDDAGNVSDITIFEVTNIDKVADSDEAGYVFISSKFNEKTTGKKQNGIVLEYGVNAFSSLEEAGDLTGKTVIQLDGTTSTDYTDSGVVAGNAAIPTVKETDDSYSYNAASTAKGTLTLDSNTGSTEFIRFATVNLEGADVGDVSGGNSTSRENTKATVDKKGNETEIANTSTSSTLSGKFTGNAGSAGRVAGYATVNLTETSVGELSGGTEKTSTSSKVVEGETKDQKNLSSSESSAASGKVTLKKGASAEVIENYQNVTLTGAEVEKVTNFTSKDSKKESATFDEAKNKVTRTVTLTHTESTSGTLKATGSTLGDVTGFATVTLKDVEDAGNFSRVDENGAAYSSVKETVSVKTNKDNSVTESYKKIETFIRSGKFTAANSNVGDIRNFSTVTLDGTSAKAVSNFVESKIVTEGSRNYANMEAYGTPEDYVSEWKESELTSKVTTSLNGSVTLKNGASAVSITNFKSVTMTDSSVGTISNVGKVTVNKGESSITSYTGSSGNDTLTIAKGAVLTAKAIDLKEGKDTLSLNGTLILTGTAFNVDKITGKGEIAANSEIYKDLDIDYANVLDLGATSKNFRGTAYETADDSYKKAVKWDGEESFTGWLGSWEGGKEGSDTVDHIRFKAEEGLKLEVSEGVSWTLLDKNGNDIGQSISAAGEYILELTKATEESSVAYSVKLA